MLDFNIKAWYNSSMEEFKNTIANNLMELRKANKLTQLELAEKLNYSDKAISKWERGESLPDILMLKQLADMYNVNVDYILTKHSDEVKAKYRMPKPELNNKLIITLLSCLFIWLLATILYINFKIMFDHYYWIVWIWALPVTSLVLVIFSSIWGRKLSIILSVSALVWTLILSAYLTLLQYNIWTLFLLGIPAQLAIGLCGKIKRKSKD
ncbi:MAG: helix-turn-helix domain-containing protein [Clostridia bacterium]